MTTATITISDLSTLLKAQLSGYPGSEKINPTELAKKYLPALASFSRHTVEQAVIRACQNNPKYLPSAFAIAEQCRQAAPEIPDTDLAELETDLQKAYRLNDTKGQLELKAAIAQRTGSWKPMTVDQQRAEYLERPVSPASTQTDALRQPLAAKQSEEILLEHRRYWSQRVQDVAYLAAQPVDEQKIARVALTSIQQILKAGHTAHARIQSIEKPAPVCNPTVIRQIAAMGEPANSQISVESGPNFV